MTLHVYAVCYNEEVLLPHFLRHYGAIAERIVVFDGGSTDRSCDLVRATRGAVLVPTGEAGGRFSEEVLMRLRNEAYKRSRGKADWVAVVDIDEFLHHADLRALLARYQEQGVTLPKTQGFDMVGDAPPGADRVLTDEIRCGFSNPFYSKRAIFSPEIDIRFEPGCHRCDPRGKIVESDEPEIRLLHYRFLGADFFARKYMLRQERMSEESRRAGHGTHLTVPGDSDWRPLYPATEDDLRRRYDEVLRGRTLETAVA